MYHPTRRTLLRSVGAAAGSAAVYRTMDALGMLGPGDARAAALDLPPGSGKGGRVVNHIAGHAALDQQGQQRRGFEGADATRRADLTSGNDGVRTQTAGTVEDAVA